MGRWVFFSIFLSIFALSVCAFDTVSAEPSGTVSYYILSDLQYEIYDGLSRIIFASNEKIDFVSYELQEPYRIVIDFIGISFCELQEHVEYDKGLVKAIDIIETPYVQQPEGLDSYFYAIDYIIITPVSKLPFKISLSGDKKVIAVDIGEKHAPGVKVSNVTVSGDTVSKEDSASGEDSRDSIINQELIGKGPEPEPETEEVIEEDIIDYIGIETLEDALLVIITSNKQLPYTVQRDPYTGLSIIVKPLNTVYTELQEYAEFNTSYISSLRIIKDESAQVPEALGDYYYPVQCIVVEPNIDLPFDFYSNIDSTISILEIYDPDIGKEAERVIAEADKEAELLERKARQDLLRQLKEEIKKEGLLKQEKLAEFKKQELEKRKEQAAEKAETIGKEVLKDLIVRGKGILSLENSQAVALKNSPQAMTSKREAELARLKQRDAFRALFPNVKLKASHTVGDVTGDVAFTEELYGVEGEQALYQGGRLSNAYKQSKINVELAQAKYSKLENDLDFKVAEAYYNVVAAIMNIRLQKELLDEAAEIAQTAERRHAAGLSTDHEILNVKSRYNQIQFQLATAERDLALARFKLKQAMGLDISEQEIDVSEVDTELNFKVIDVDLNECLKAASNNQPDIVLNKLIVESHEYEEKITRGKEDFRVDITGFYGRGDSYYDTEPKNLDNNWSIGLKVSRPFWFATPSYSFTKDKTSIKVGETDRTGSTVNAGEIAILDKNALSIGSEIEESRINRQKAENELIEIRRQAALNIKEAYYNYQESILQVKNALEKVRFHEEAVKVARAQAGLNEALQSQLLEALVQLSDEKSVYIKALSDYNLAIVKINKAIGIKDYYSVD